MSKKPRNKYLQKIHVKQDGKYDFKKDKPWKPEKEPSIWDNIDLSDLQHGFRNETHAKRFSKHQYRQRME